MASMAPSLPIPVPPGSPTPPSDDERIANGLGINANSDMAPPKVVFDENSLSPKSENFPVARHVHGTQSSPSSLGIPLGFSSPNSLNVPTGESSRVDGDNGNSSPFNFETTVLAKSPVVKSGFGQRRGHKYKHSSVSHQIFLEPPPRAPLALPNSLPVPTLTECRKSMSIDQKRRLWWSICHILFAAYTVLNAQGSLALTALSRLILYDSMGALCCVAVDVLGNFEVWKRSSIRHPFGLERSEVLGGFAMSVLLLFMGIDLVSHNLTHSIESFGHEAHHEHDHERVGPGTVDLVALLAIMATLISALGLKNHARIGKVLRFAYIESLPSLFSNPSHFLTLSCSALLLLLPLLSIQMYTWLDRPLSVMIAFAMVALGIRLVKVLGSMLLMSFTGSEGIPEVIRDLEADPAVSEVEDAKFWQVHYGLCMANLKLRVRGSDEVMMRLRDKVNSLVRNRLGGGYGGGGGQKWEVTLQLTVEQS